MSENISAKIQFEANLFVYLYEFQAFIVFGCIWYPVADPGGVRWVRPHPPSDLILSFFLTIFFRTNVFLRHPHPPSGLILPFPSNFLSEVRIFVSFAPSFKNFWIRPWLIYAIQKFVLHDRTFLIIFERIQVY